MKIGLFSIGAGRAAQPETIVQLAQKAEEVGFESIFAPEHTVLFPAEAYTSVYPYSEDGKISGLRREGDTDLLDPFLALTWAAAHTKTIRLGTGRDRLREPNWRLTLCTARSMPYKNAKRLLSCCFAVTEHL